MIGWSGVGNMIGVAANFALPSVILILLFGQTRIFFVMSRDGLLPEGLSKIHPKWKTPYVVTAITGSLVAVAAAFLPVGQLADIANAGTLYAFMMVAIAVLVLRKTQADRPRSFRTPFIWVIAPLTVAGRSEEHTSELQSLMRISYAVFCLKKKNTTPTEKQM